MMLGAGNARLRWFDTIILRDDPLPSAYRDGWTRPVTPSSEHESRRDHGDDAEKGWSEERFGAHWFFLKKGESAVV